MMNLHTMMTTPLAPLLLISRGPHLRQETGLPPLPSGTQVTPGTQVTQVLLVHQATQVTLTVQVT